jgi:prolyl oligopeptidase
MRHRRRSVTVLWLTLVALAGAAAPAAAQPDPAARLGGRGQERGREARPDVNPLRAAIDDYWDDLLRRHPLEATVFVGDHRFDDRLNDPSAESYRVWLGRLRQTRIRVESAGAGESPPREFTPEERIARQVLLEMIDDRLALEPFGDHLIPLTQLLRTPTDVRADDLHLVFAQLGEHHPANTAGDVENYERRLAAFPKLVDALIALMRQGVAEKRVPPRVVAAKVLAQLRALAALPPEGTPLWTFLNRLPNDFPADEYHEAVEHIRYAIRVYVTPSYNKLAAFVESEYLPACRTGVGLCGTPDGREHYARLVRHYTTTDLTPEQIHETGLAQLAKARAAMEEVRRRAGFAGDLPAFLAHVRDDPALRARDARAILVRHRAILAEMNREAPRLFGRLPATPCEVRPFDPVRARTAPAGEYLPMPSDGSRPGVFYVNTHDATSRPTYTMQALAYHEAVPGHHLQGALAAESAGRPAFRRYFYIPAFDEGWALYAEGLPAEIGLYRDPYAEIGRLSYDAQRCARLVVDTGIHANGWTRDRAVAYFEANTALPRNEVENEVDRYIAWPGQALAYKVGELTIREIRARCEKRLGARFDLRAFHDRLLSFGSVPLRLLERLMDEPEPSPSLSPPSTPPSPSGPR